jgi:hypothetical protein
MLPTLYIIYNSSGAGLEPVVRELGFRGDYKEELWDWLLESVEQFGKEWDTNWVRSFKEICRLLEEGVDWEEGSPVIYS